MSNNQKMDKILQWTAGITLPLLIVVLSAIWGMSSSMQAWGAEHEVLKVRVDAIERAILDIRSSAERIDRSVDDIEVSQAKHNSLIETKVEYIRREVDDLKTRLK